MTDEQVSDSDKAADMMKLFGISYFKDENHNETGKRTFVCMYVCMYVCMNVRLLIFPALQMH
jgi:hypothetical protein